MRCEIEIECEEGKEPYFADEAAASEPADRAASLKLHADAIVSRPVTEMILSHVRPDLSILRGEFATSAGVLSAFLATFGLLGGARPKVAALLAFGLLS